MPRFIADRLAAQLTAGASILTLGLTFKENVPDLRNSKAELALELRARPRATTHDPLADRTEAQALYGLILLALLPEDQVFDAVLGAVPHRAYARLDGARLVALDCRLPRRRASVDPADPSLKTFAWAKTSARECPNHDTLFSLCDVAGPGV